MKRTNLAARIAATILVSSVLAGCGGDDTPAVCSSVDSLKASVEDVKNVDVSRSGLSELKKDLAQVRSDLTEVKADAKDQYSSEVDGVKQAAASLSSDLSAASASPSAATFAPVASDIKGLGAALTALRDAVKDTC